ncbi:hypothetical protein NDU88_003064 [Pleurodeles waltl]|uniref:Uncharacterized protein n=1 Tax=Pleurodeles waltl TaxID=8319 RepID=A0AAV7RBU1_PLEWA|nr:hypothetical protein NDU88_003064 [Pleurodeles waltl]
MESVDGDVREVTEKMMRNREETGAEEIHDKETRYKDSFTKCHTSRATVTHILNNPCIPVLWEVNYANHLQVAHPYVKHSDEGSINE